jgi:hypothetical protein
MLAQTCHIGPDSLYGQRPAGQPQCLQATRLLYAWLQPFLFGTQAPEVMLAVLPTHVAADVPS